MTLNTKPPSRPSFPYSFMPSSEHAQVPLIFQGPQGVGSYPFPLIMRICMSGNLGIIFLLPVVGSSVPGSAANKIRARSLFTITRIVRY